MTIQLVACPHCRAIVAATKDGSCPACQKKIPAPTESTPATSPSCNRIAADKSFKQILVCLTTLVIITPAIVLANVAVFIIMTATGAHFFAPTTDDLLAWGGNFGPQTMNGEWWRLVTCTFLHAGVLHLLFNMWFLLGIGSLVERLVGPIGFLLLYFVTAIAGSIASLAWNPTVVAVGASGAVYGVMGALLALVILRRHMIPLPVLKQLRNSAAFFLLYNVYCSITIPSIDVAAHIGGCIAGIICGLILSQPLELKLVRRRWNRNCALASISLVAIPCMLWALPEPPLDIQKELQKFADVEQSVISTYTTLLNKWQSREISDHDFADAISRDVIAPWKATHENMAQLHGVPYANHAVVDTLRQYMELREKSWTIEVEGLREQNSSKLKQAEKASRAADEIAESLTGS